MTKEDWREKAQICTGLHCGCQSSVLNLVIVKKGEPFILEFIFVNTDLKLIVFESGLSGFGNA